MLVHSQRRTLAGLSALMIAGPADGEQFGGYVVGRVEALVEVAGQAQLWHIHVVVAGELAAPPALFAVVFGVAGSFGSGWHVDPDAGRLAAFGAGRLGGLAVHHRQRQEWT